ncbi:metalloregulatory protein [Colletotrichum karsti]|uniref:Metalloregulatory protein n=1 Tax=Colletotrichum karsti TaxID=1095194 RepID=A0A9P6IA73_9PEZI|nr:metalloregulatory protein [Colletotrichum karsti]KAF9879998.1 metalloregulatory protein [Colletotrichum karsti]
MADPNNELASFGLHDPRSALNLSPYYQNDLNNNNNNNSSNNNNDNSNNHIYSHMFYQDADNTLACHLPHDAHDDSCLDANALHGMYHGKPEEPSAGFLHARSMSIPGPGPPARPHLTAHLSEYTNTIYYNAGVEPFPYADFMPQSDSPQSSPRISPPGNTESSPNDNDDCNSDCRLSHCEACTEGGEPCHDTDCNANCDTICDNAECKDAATPCTDTSCLAPPDHSVQAAANVLARLPADPMSGQTSSYGFVPDHTPFHDGLSGAMGQSMGFQTASAAPGLLGNNYVDFTAMDTWVLMGHHVSQYHASGQYGAGADCIDPSCVYTANVENLEFPLERCPLPYQSHAHPGQQNFCIGQNQENLQLCQFQPTSKDAWLEHVKQQHPCVPQDHSLMHANINFQNQSVSNPNSNIRLNIPTSMSPAIASPTSSSPAYPQSSPQTPLTPVDSIQDDYRCKWVEKGLICGMECKDDDELQKHCRDVHLQVIVKAANGFKCQWNGCSRAQDFSQKSKLERHLQTHTGFKPVKCTVCGVALSAKQSLAQHMRIHTGEKPWVCRHPGCGSSFKQQSALTMHTRTHTGVKPLKCDICGKAFGESSNLSKHKKTHNIKGQYSCEICGKDFHRLDQQRRHMKVHAKDNASIESSPTVDSPGTIANMPIRKLSQDRVTKRK